MSDITKFKEAEEVLKRYATIDEMTGLLNKHIGMIYLENTFNHAKADEMVLVLNNYNRKLGEQVALRIEKNIRQVAVDLANPYEIHISSGLAVLSEQETLTSDALLSIVDNAMYENIRIYNEKCNFSRGCFVSRSIRFLCAQHGRKLTVESPECGLMVPST